MRTAEAREVHIGKVVRNAVLFGCATVEGLLLLKLYALPSLYRQGNFARVALYEGDIATLMHDYRPPVEPLFEELREHLSDTDLASLRKIVGEIQERIERFDRQS
jgi:hypothetical protein